MPLYTKESLELLRQRVDLAEVIGAQVSLKRSGSTYKALCPFHDEKTPSFVVHKGDTHYHCFGCGAHGDAIAFLMNYQRLGFVEAIEALAEKFGVALERAAYKEPTGPSKQLLRDALGVAAELYHFLLTLSEEGSEALSYLYERGIDLDFINKFQIGYAPKSRTAAHQFLFSKGFSEEVLAKSGLISLSEQSGIRDFFWERITFPIRDAMGHVIGFSARQFREGGFGGKYINTAETPLFKKSHVLFGLSYSRKRMVKEKKALIVEGQIDCLRLIQQGFDWAVAGQGTAFGETHVQELVQLGIQTVYLALDADKAGEEAAVKIGDLFQKRGIEVRVVQLPQGQDPDLILRLKGAAFFEELLAQSRDYLTFLVQRAKGLDTPAGKQQCASELIQQIKSWDGAVLVHESLKKLADLLKLPPEVVQLGSGPPVAFQAPHRIQQGNVDADKILETDLVRLLFLAGEAFSQLVEIARRNLSPDVLKVAPCRRLYSLALEGRSDLLACASGLESEEEEVFVSEMLQRKINPEKVEASLRATLLRILERNWLEERERIKLTLHSGSLSDDEAIALAKQFDVLKRQAPQVV